MGRVEVGPALAGFSIEGLGVSCCLFGLLGVGFVVALTLGVVVGMINVSWFLSDGEIGRAHV